MDDKRTAILEDLAAVARDRGVRILLAAESGSRAWGFPSPDSDYDVRFIYVHPLDRYLTVRPTRDVIELPLRGGLDVAGWDLRKALALAIKPNPQVLEWLSSPTRYLEEPTFLKRFAALAGHAASRKASLHHYLNIGRNAYQEVAAGPRAKIKRYLYVIRAAAALTWLKDNPSEAWVPMNLAAALAGTAAGQSLRRAVDAVVREKAGSLEGGLCARRAAIDRFVADAFAYGDAAVQGAFPKPPDLSQAADEIFRDTVLGKLYKARPPSRPHVP